MNSNITLYCPNTFVKDREWIASNLLSQLTSNFHIVTEDRDNWKLCIHGSELSIYFSDVLIPLLRGNPKYKISTLEYFKTSTIVKKELPFDNLPILHKTNGDTVHLDKKIFINVDVFGMGFWSMSRWEEVFTVDTKDEHGRFLSQSSCLSKYELLDRPWVDEWMLYIKTLIEELLHTVSLKNNKGRMLLSHDVDQPGRYYFCTFLGLVRKMCGDLILRKDCKGALLGLKIYFSSKSEIDPRDVYNTFDWIMTQSEEFGLTSSFNFIAGHSCAKYDPEYKLSDPAIINLMINIHYRGHNIGLHPSYATYLHPVKIKSEADYLKKVCLENGIEQKKWGGRMHYLRWSTPITLHGWELSNMSYDSTLGFSDHAGFMCGTCHEYTAYDVLSRRTLRLVIRPLIVMECSVLDKMGFKKLIEAEKYILELKKKCYLVGGNFTMLWHNSYLYKERYKAIYKNIIKS
jgi:hypothetical protein